ncbi:inositol -triphosphate 5 6 kinase, putative [Ichthyophthirius multifiliis]|uniref:Inositol-triphosphate 5 6 kinase, putative n=1 Tax=Ichthyophthirius multifiliis TaxID=5932 RepID=G0R0B2_ICHMU|nr:inositol -triphosphate 5 6 kinase, putative [Ichthyophthirius multifiliis]EGR29090.1 inositol -triphosphate 5 6 kinase, putative [Ichthyophthirius multifiliis]|eukprot:XP_004030326.1 inositol -triphosphate 5 6 kinase, putative [Ichthyophthirius multifiliis]
MKIKAILKKKSITIFPVYNKQKKVQNFQKRKKMQRPKNNKNWILFCPKKQNNLIQAKVLLGFFPFQYFPLDFLNDYQEIPFNGLDLVLHKLQDFYKELEIEEKVLNVQKIDLHFQQFFKKFPQIVVLDDMKYYNILNNRVNLQNFIENILKDDQIFNTFIQKFPQIQLKVPQMVIFNPLKDSFDDFFNKNKQELNYPLLIKPTTACSTQLSHFMAIILHEKGLNKAIQTKPFNQTEIIIQELINHDGKIYKLYSIGNYTEKQVRASIPNIDTQKYQQEEGIWYFDSQKSFFSQLPIACEQKIENKYFELNKQVVNEISQLIIRQLKINLFGFDIVKKTKTQEYYIIDINYFPGYKDFKDVCEKMQQLYYEILNKK